MSKTEVKILFVSFVLAALLFEQAILVAWYRMGLLPPLFIHL